MEKRRSRRIDRPSKVPIAAIQNPKSRIQNPIDLARLAPGLERLAEALLLARIGGEDPWQRALAPSDLAPFGLTLNDCRALLAEGLIDTDSSKFKVPSSKLKQDRSKTLSGRKVAGSLREPSATPSPIGGKRQSKSKSPSPSGRGRGDGPSVSPSLRPSSSPPLGPRTLLILTDLGLAKLTAILPRQPSPSGRGQGEGFSVSPSPQQPSPFGRGQGEGVPRSPLLPSYDIDSRQLSVTGEVILRLPVQARNLAAVLTALELSGWMPRVAKPLNGRPDGNEPAHLHDAAYSLNLRQTLIDFHADGGALRWEWRSPAGTPDQASRDGWRHASLLRQVRRVRRERRENVD